MKFIFTDKDQYFEDEYQEKTLLSEETGWWTAEGIIYIWTPGLSRLQQVGIAVHEGFEYLMVHKILRRIFRVSDANVKDKGWFDFLSDVFHNIANCLEFIASLGTADVAPGEQYWRIGEWNLVIAFPSLSWKKR